MKKILFALIISFSLFAQAEYVNIGSPVYEFLNRMHNLGVIVKYNQFETPKSRSEIAAFLQQVILSINLLDDSDRRLIEDFKVEFEYELYKTDNHAASILGSKEYDILADQEKYLLHFVDESKMTMYINLLAEGEFIIGQNKEDGTNSALLMNVGGELRGTVLNKVGFYLRGTNGVASGNRNTTLVKKELQYNFKFNEKLDERFFDETQAYITADFDLLKLKLGRDRLNLGYGTNKFLLDNNSPLFDYLSFKINYDFFNFSYIHGKLLGDRTILSDSISGENNIITEKYFVYHRMGFDISRHLNFGLSEVIVYGDRPIDLSYLVPFSFLKSVEHSNQDRDNSMLIFDLSNHSIPNTSVYATFLIDDIAFGKIGKGWWGNQTLFNIGVHSSPFYLSIPLDFKFEYMRLEPYTYSHRLSKNSYTHFGYNLGTALQPNSELFFLEISYRFTNRLTLTADFTYSNHGANVVNLDGTIKNVGGDIKLGHRTFDLETVKFLDGNLEIHKSISAKLSYEPINQISLFIDACYTYASPKTEQSQYGKYIFLGTNFKF